MSELHEKLGSLLRLERERQDTDLKDVSEELKITIDNLKAIESGDVSALPAELYFNLFAKSYAERLGIDYGRTIEAIKDELPEYGSENNSRPDKAKPAIPISKTTPDETESKTVVSATRLPLPGRRLLTIVAASAALLVVVIVLINLITDDDDLRTEEPIAVVDETADLSRADTANTVAAEQDDYNWNSPGYSPPPDLVLNLAARVESWATVVADGDTAVYRNLTPGREYRVEAKYRILVSIGVPSGVDVTLNGQRISLIDETTRRVSRVEINQTNVESFLHGETGHARLQSHALEVEPAEATDTTTRPGDTVFEEDVW